MKRLPFVLSIAALGSLTGCGIEGNIEGSLEGDANVCAQAMQHVASCMGRTLTPPVSCSADDEHEATAILEKSCLDFEAGSEDGCAFGDWACKQLEEMSRSAQWNSLADPSGDGGGTCFYQNGHNCRSCSGMPGKGQCCMKRSPWEGLTYYTWAPCQYVSWASGSSSSGSKASTSGSCSWKSGKNCRVCSYSKHTGQCCSSAGKWNPCQYVSWAK